MIILLILALLLLVIQILTRGANIKNSPIFYLAILTLLVYFLLKLF